MSTVNGAINGFVTGAYGEFLQKGFRINVVSPALVEGSAEALDDFFPGHIPAKMEHVASGYEKSVKRSSPVRLSASAKVNFRSVKIKSPAPD